MKVAIALALGALQQVLVSVPPALTAPTNVVAPVISGTAETGQILTCTEGLWTGNPAPTYAYQWKRNGVNIGAATNSTYTLQVADESANITCTVTATNSQGNASATSNTIVPSAGGGGSDIGELWFNDANNSGLLVLLEDI
jgi:hypothetical protein